MEPNKRLGEAGKRHVLGFFVGLVSLGLFLFCFWGFFVEIQEICVRIRKKTNAKSYIYRQYMSITLLKHTHVLSIVSSYVQSNCSDHRRDLLNIIVEIPGGESCIWYHY